MSQRQKHGSWWSRMLPAGESIGAPVGIAMALFVIATTLALGGWTLWTMHRDRVTDASACVERTGAILAPSIASVLGQEDMESARQLLAAAAKAEHLRSVRIILPDSTTLVESDDTGPARTLPASGQAIWSRPLAAPARVLTGDSVLNTFDIEIPGHGRVALELKKEIPGGFALSWEATTGLGVASGAAFVFLLVAYRWIRRRLRVVGMIREALGEIQAGETQTAALAVAHEYGPEAIAWNQLLSERDRLRAQLLADQAREQLAKRAGGAGHLALACDALWNGVLVIDEKQRIAYANAAAAAFLGDRRERLGEGTVSDHLKDAAALETIRGIFSGRVRRRTSVEVKRADGAGVLRFTIRAIGRDDAGGAVVFIEDITQQKIADESRNSFVAQATHELRTPLTNIRLYVEQAIEAGEGDATTRASALNVINQESLRLERIVSDMLSVSEIEAGSIKLRSDDVRLDALFDDLRGEFTPQAAEKGLTLTFEIPPKLPVIHGDRDKLGQALHNIVGNALKYTPSGGRVAVKVDASSGRLSVDITDSGFGIAPEEQELVFEKFYRAKDTRVHGVGGTGLGLPLAREVARLHGGDLTLRSELNKGSTFTLFMPIVTETAKAA